MFRIAIIVVFALAQGPEADYAKCENIARTFFAPVMKSHLYTVEQMAILSQPFQNLSRLPFPTHHRTAVQEPQTVQP